MTKEECLNNKENDKDEEEKGEGEGELQKEEEEEDDDDDDIDNDDDDNYDDDDDDDNIIPTRDLFLSADERYDVWEVKRQERPFLLGLDNDHDNKDEKEEEEKKDSKNEIDSTTSDNENRNDENFQKEEEDNDNDTLPLVDGCDIPNWRKYQIVKTSTTSSSMLLQGAFNVGSGCFMFRRESQLPIVLSSRQFQYWNELQQKFLLPIPIEHSCRRITATEAQQLSYSPWFEKENIPVVIEKEYIVADWNAMKTCTWDHLVSTYGNYSWRFSDTHGACMTLQTYHKYATTIEGMVDDAPLAVYDSQFHLDERKCLLQDYTVPKCFDGPDLFDLKETETTTTIDTDTDDTDLDDPYERPPYRWILMGPERSGTGLHIDPLGTHAWVTLIEGKKRWVLFPPDTNLEDIGMANQPHQIPSAIWFATWYDRALQNVKKQNNTTNTNNNNNDNKNIVEVLQLPGETVYVPAGWPHLVLNVERSVAITHNYATEYPCFEQFATCVYNEEPEFYQLWKTKLQLVRPDLKFPK